MALLDCVVQRRHKTVVNVVGFNTVAVEEKLNNIGMATSGGGDYQRPPVCASTVGVNRMQLQQLLGNTITSEPGSQRRWLAKLWCQIPCPNYPAQMGIGAIDCIVRVAGSWACAGML